MGTKTFNNYESLLTFTRASKGHALRPVSYGSELVTNGDFDSDTTGWAAARCTAAVSSGQVVLTSTDTNPVFTQTLNLTIGKLYRVEGDIIGSTGTAVPQINMFDSGFSSYDNLSASGSFSFIPTTATNYLQLRVQGTTVGDTATFDNISVKEVTFDKSDGTLTLFEHPDNIPRVEWDAQRNRLGLLVEEARTNLATYSEDLSQGSAVNSPTITTNIATAPNGIETVDGIQDTSGGNFKRVKLFSGAVSANSTYTGSLFVKKETVETNYGGVVLSFTAGTSNRTCYGIIDAVNGTISPATANNITATFTVTDVGDFWRFSITGTDTGSNTQLEFGVYGTLSVDGSTTGTGAGSVRRVWGAQLEAGSFPTSYIKTTGATATRSADVASIPVADFGFNADAGSILIEYQTATDEGVTRIAELESDANNRVTLFQGGLGEAPKLFVNNGGVSQADYGTANVTVAGPNKLATAFKENDTALVLAGGAVAIDTTVALPIVDTLLLGNSNAAGDLNGHIKSIKYYPRRLTNAQLQEITS
jgi:hypothetical protein